MQELEIIIVTDLKEMARLGLTGQLVITKPGDCPGFGQELPAEWVCPPCPIAEECMAALLGGEREGE